MKLITVVDERNGLTFGRRRLSRDRLLIERVMEKVGKSRLWMDGYTAEMFGNAVPVNVCIGTDWFSKATDLDYAFLERIPEGFNMKEITEIIKFCWNRHYPSDAQFPILLPSEGWHLIYRRDFQGYSHEKITEEEWKREK